MIRKYNNRKLPTNPWHRKEEPLNHHGTPGRQTKPSNHLSLPIKDDCITRIHIKQRTTKHITNTYSYYGSNNKQQVTTTTESLPLDSSLSHGGRGGLNACYWY